MPFIDRDEEVEALPADGADQSFAYLPTAPTNWVSGVQYDYAGRLTNMSYLTGPLSYVGYWSYQSVSESRSYNVNGQLASIGWPSWSGVQYVYSATGNNGQIEQEVDSFIAEVTTINYQYDALKRMISAAATPTQSSQPPYNDTYSQTFQYDGFGNLTAKVLNGTTTPITVNAATNRLTNAYYDLNGNMTSGAGGTFTYDEANRIRTVSETSGGQENYGYDPANKRVYVRDTNQSEWFTLYGAKGEKLGVYGVDTSGGTCANTYQPGTCSFPVSPQSTSVWFAGRLIMDLGNAFQPDRLGTNRTNYSWFLPYGDGPAGNDHVQFATYTRDSYTGLDYADQRFYASTYGRFNTPDPAGAKAASPGDSGSWNRYAYTRGDPVNRVDPGGTDSCDPTTQFDCLTGYYCPPEDGSCSYIASNQCPDPNIYMALTESPDAPTFEAQAAALGCYSAQFIPAQAAAAAPPPPICDIQLRDVNFPVKLGGAKGVHTYLDVTINGVQEILEGISSRPILGSVIPRTSWLQASVLPTGINIDDPSNTTTNRVDFDSKNTDLSMAAICNDASSLEAAAMAFPSKTYRYSLTGFGAPNSNSFTRYLLTFAPDLGSIPGPPLAVGWSDLIGGR